MAIPMRFRVPISAALIALASFVVSSPFSFAQDEDDQEQLIRSDKFPANFGVAKSSVSPDGAYGVLAPADFDHYDENGKPQNQLVEMKTGRILATIQAETGLIHMNHGGILPSHWSADGNYLLWSVDGKWCPRALALLKIESGQLKWQRNILTLAQKEILARTKKASPKKYAAAKKENSENGSYYPDGFTVNVTIDGQEDEPVKFPLTIHVDLDSNPKGIDDLPEDANISSEMTATMGEDGNLVVKDFHLGRKATK